MSFALLTQSRLRASRRCQRLHHIQYELGYRPLEDALVLRFGSFVHRFLEAWWVLRQRGVNGDELLEQALAWARERTEGLDPFEQMRAEWLMRGYHVRWEGSPYEVLAVEAPFETELRNPTTGAASRTWHLAGKLDVVVRDIRDSRVLLVEHKTSSEDITQGSAYWARLRMDGQVSVYYEGARSLGHAVSGCIYDVLGKPKQQPLKATPEESRKYTAKGALYANQRADDETPEAFGARVAEAIAEEPGRFYQQGEVVRLEAEMAEALFDIWQLGQQIRESELAGRHPRNPDGCMKYNQQCPFFDVCSGAASLDDPTRFTRSTDIHPELMPKEEAI